MTKGVYSPFLQLVDVIRMSTDQQLRARAANDLLELIVKEKRFEIVGELLGDRQAEVASAAIWIASELGSTSSPFTDQIAQFIQSSRANDRFFALDAILSTTSTNADGRTIALMPLLLQDCDRSVQWKAMDVLSRANTVQLVAAFEYVNAGTSPSLHSSGLSLLLLQDSLDQIELTKWLSSDIQLTRQYGAVAAARIATISLEPLHLASFSDDKTIADFARSRIQHLTDKARIQSE